MADQHLPSARQVSAGKRLSCWRSLRWITFSTIHVKPCEQMWANMSRYMYITVLVIASSDVTGIIVFSRFTGILLHTRTIFACDFASIFKTCHISFVINVRVNLWLDSKL